MKKASKTVRQRRTAELATGMVQALQLISNGAGTDEEFERLLENIRQFNREAPDLPTRVMKKVANACHALDAYAGKIGEDSKIPFEDLPKGCKHIIIYNPDCEYDENAPYSDKVSKRACIEIGKTVYLGLRYKIGEDEYYVIDWCAIDKDNTTLSYVALVRWKVCKKLWNKFWEL